MPSLPDAIVPLLVPPRVALRPPHLAQGADPADGGHSGPGRRTVSTALYALGLQARGDFALFHHVLSRASWSSLAVSRVLWEQLVRHLVPTGPIRLAIDETLERCRGEQIEALGVYRDPVRSSHGHCVKAKGVRRVSLMLLATCQGMDPPVTYLTRQRLDAVLPDPPPPRRPGQRGRPRIVGSRQSSLQALLADPAGCRDPQVLLCTNPDWSPTAILATCLQRWQVAAAFQEVRTHLGVETQRQWSAQAIACTTPVLLGLSAGSSWSPTAPAGPPGMPRPFPPSPTSWRRSATTSGRRPCLFRCPRPPPTSKNCPSRPPRTAPGRPLLLGLTHPIHSVSTATLYKIQLRSPENQEGCPNGTPLLDHGCGLVYEPASISAARNSLVSSSSACRASSSPSWPSVKIGSMCLSQMAFHSWYPGQ